MSNIKKAMKKAAVKKPVPVIPKPATKKMGKKK
jgi:hypothetical protein